MQPAKFRRSRCTALGQCYQETCLKRQHLSMTSIQSNPILTSGIPVVRYLNSSLHSVVDCHVPDSALSSGFDAEKHICWPTIRKNVKSAADCHFYLCMCTCVQYCMCYAKYVYVPLASVPCRVWEWRAGARIAAVCVN